ncbi:phage portal protein [Bradyrhizobium sp.]|uniref:phage portal protein n=1 Tax=Bradyrhizobium sp. TaxID=376 RepID=UPI0025C00F0D|nr:phage portal protein [Bradyrhizobium sp.]
MNAHAMLAAGVSRRTLVDRLVEWVAPSRGLERLQARVKLSAALGAGGYKGGAGDRRATKLWRPYARSADGDAIPDLHALRARSRDLVRNTPVATGAIATVVTNVVGDGLQLQPELEGDSLGMSETAVEAWEKRVSREWHQFCRTADFSRVQRFAELQALAFRAVLESGDVLVVRRFRRDPGEVYGTKLQLIEADRLSNPGLVQTAMRLANGNTLVGGVEVDGDGVHVAYWISDRHPGECLPTGMRWSRIPARSPEGEQVVLHLYDRLRPDMTRGVPYLTPVIEHIKQLGDYTDAEVTAAVISAMTTVFVETPTDDDSNPPLGEKSASLAENEVALGNGAIVSLSPGEKANLVNPTRPNSNFDPFVQAFLRQVGVALELPFELLVKHFTASYSASRAALEMAWQFFRRRRVWLAQALCQTVYEWFLADAVSLGRLDADKFFDDPVIRQSYCRALWIGPNRISIDPKKEAEADALDIATGVKTRQQVCLERTGGEFDDKVAQLGKEKTALDAAGLVPTASEPEPASTPEPDEDERAEETAAAMREGYAAMARALAPPVVNVSIDNHPPKRGAVVKRVEHDAAGRATRIVETELSEAADA